MRVARQRYATCGKPLGRLRSFELDIRVRSPLFSEHVVRLRARIPDTNTIPDLVVAQ